MGSREGEERRCVRMIEGELPGGLAGALNASYDAASTGLAQNNAPPESLATPYSAIPPDVGNSFVVQSFPASVTSPSIGPEIVATCAAEAILMN